MVGQPYNPDNCAFLSSQSLNANQFNPNVPYSTNNTTHLILWDFVEKKILWVNSQTNLIESEIGGADLPTNVGNLVINETSEPQSTLVREYYNGFFVKRPLVTVTGTTNETILATLFVPANTFKVGDAFSSIAFLEFAINTNSASDDSFLKLYYNSTPNLSGATLISNQPFGAGNDAVSRSGFYDGKQIKKITSNSGYTGDVDASIIPFDYTYVNEPMFNVTQDVYLIASITPQDSGCAFAAINLYSSKVLNGQLITP